MTEAELIICLLTTLQMDRCLGLTAKNIMDQKYKKKNTKKPPYYQYMNMYIH